MTFLQFPLKWKVRFTKLDNHLFTLKFFRTLSEAFAANDRSKIKNLRIKYSYYRDFKASDGANQKRLGFATLPQNTKNIQIREYQAQINSADLYSAQ